MRKPGELKDCPFCGGSAGVWSLPRKGETGYKVRCDICGAETNPVFGARTKSERKGALAIAVRRWNRRAGWHGGEP